MKGLATLEKMKPLEPLDFCRIYSRYTESHWGYKSQWNSLLAKSLKISARTVEGWGENFQNCPDRYKRELEMIHGLTVAKQALERLGIDPTAPEKPPEQPPDGQG